jgi:Cu/Ag efflux protein CusF
MTRQGFVHGSVLAAGLVALLAAGATAQTRSLGEMKTATFTIAAIDATNRVVTLKGKDDRVELVYAGPEVKRFDELKVGDKVNVRYHESVVFQIQKPGAAPPPAINEEPTLTRTPGPNPGGTISQQETATVTVITIDPKAESITLKMPNGSISSFEVKDKKNLKGLKAGDRVQVTYTRALAVSVEPGT